MTARLGEAIALRVGASLVSLVFVVVAVFFITSALPGDVAEALLGQAATPDAIAALRHSLRLDQPVLLRFAGWTGGLLRGDFGTSLVSHQPVLSMVHDHLLHSLLLAGITTLFAVPAALLLGTLSAIFRNTVFDRTISLLTLCVVSVPEFLIATLAVLVFAVELHLLPALASISDIHSIGSFLAAFSMPVATLGCVIVGQMARMTRAVMMNVLSSSWVEMAMLKGVSPAFIILRHVLPNVIAPLFNVIALSLSYLLGGVVIVESVFHYPGIASLMVDSVASRDIPLVQTCAIIFCAAYLLLTTLADIVALCSSQERTRA
ncbi:ABC transporter permease [Acetobacter tropicalis]|uniref:ABC transporter permease n=1 Tax=Acetobacter tropicalis TaxID=104102 RepID=A0A252A7C2_9PROT|nr:ABC transporter permease [Acetobacter tropicalis]OUI85485.1 ABC transporter permease [Acetobacter tropicalis]